MYQLLCSWVSSAKSRRHVSTITDHCWCWIGQKCVLRQWICIGDRRFQHWRGLSCTMISLITGLVLFIFYFMVVWIILMPVQCPCIEWWIHHLNGADNRMLIYMFIHYTVSNVHYGCHLCWWIANSIQRLLTSSCNLLMVAMWIVSQQSSSLVCSESTNSSVCFRWHHSGRSGPLSCSAWLSATKVNRECACEWTYHCVTGVHVELDIFSIILSLPCQLIDCKTPFLIVCCWIIGNVCCLNQTHERLFVLDRVHHSVHLDVVVHVS